MSFIFIFLKPQKVQLVMFHKTLCSTKRLGVEIPVEPELLWSFKSKLYSKIDKTRTDLEGSEPTKILIKVGKFYQYAYFASQVRAQDSVKQIVLEKENCLSRKVRI